MGPGAWFAVGRGSGFGPAQVRTCEVGSRPIPGGGSRLSLEKARTQRVAGEGPRQVVRVWTSAGPGLQRGSPPDSGREPGFLQRKPEERAPGAMPPGPPFLWPARWHSLVLAWWDTLSRSLDYFGTHLRALIWRLSFPKMLFSIFYPENASQIGLSIPKEIASRTYQRQRSPKRASDSKRAIKPGVQGLAPGVLSPDFLQRKSGSPPESAGPRGAAPQGGFGATHPKGTPPGPSAHKIFHRMEIPYVFHRNPPQWGAHRHRAD